MAMIRPKKNDMKMPVNMHVNKRQRKTGTPMMVTKDSQTPIQVHGKKPVAGGHCL